MEVTQEEKKALLCLVKTEIIELTEALNDVNAHMEASDADCIQSQLEVLKGIEKKLA